MSLINEQQKKNASVKEPTIKAPKQASVPKQAPVSPVEGLTSDILGQEQQIVEKSPAIEPTPEVSTTADFSVEAPSLDFMPIAPVEIQQKPEPQILPTTPIWQDTSELLGNGASLKPEVTASMLPSFSVQIPDNSSTINQAFYSNNRATNDLNVQAQREAYVAAQQAQALTQKRGALPNTPDATKKWYSAPLGFMSDVLFGNERARKQSEAGVPDISTGSFGRAGAGVGGGINYLLGTIPNLFVGAVGEVNKATANSLQALGVDKNTAEGFARNGFLQFLPKTGATGGVVNELRNFRPSEILNFNFDEANKRNLIVDAVAGDPLTDVNEPDASVKYGRIYTRSQRKPGSSATSDPLGFALQIGTYILNPGEIPGDELVSLGISRLFNIIKKPGAKVAEEVVQQATKPVPDIGFNPSATPTPQQAQALKPATPRLNAGEPGGAIEFTAPNAPDLNPPRLDYGEAKIERTVNPSLPTGANPQLVPRAYTGDKTVVREALPPVFNPDDIPSLAPSLLPHNTPAKLALELGLGQPGLRIEKPGALALRTFEDVLGNIAEVKPELLEGFTGKNWSDLKFYLSDKVDDIGEFSAVGEPLPRKVSMRRIREENEEYWKTYDIMTYRPDLFATVESKARKTLGDGVEIETKDFGTHTVSYGKNTYAPPDAFKAVEDSEALFKDLGISLPEKTDVTFVDDFNTGGFWHDLDKRMTVSTASGSYDEIKLLYIHESTHKLDLYLRGLGRQGRDILDEFNASPVLKGYYPSQYASRRRFNKEEIFAEAFANVLTNRPKFEANYPQFVELVDNTIAKIKTLLDIKAKNTISTDDLLTSAEELALHKATLDVPLQKLSELFDETVDFGRKNIDETLADVINPTVAKKSVDNGGLLKFVPQIFNNAVEGELWKAADYDSLVDFYKRQGLKFDDVLPELIQNNNTYIENASRVNPRVLPSPALTTIDAPIYHGTALDNWQPPNNLYANGSRGELGHGTYFALDKNVATDYARARVGENVSPKTMDYDLNPTVAETKPSFVATLDARTPDNQLKQAFAELPEAIEREFTRAFNKKKKPLSLLQMRELMEESIVKSGVEPTEELLTQVDADISKNLRSMGYDSIVDKESGFALSLDNSKLSAPVLENVLKPSTMEAAVARYNADSIAAKHYPGLLTTDANLRDSTYKVLDQTREAVDRKLAETQDAIIQRGIEKRESVLPDPTPTNTRPTSFVNAVDELTVEDICTL